jgi:hypothetical protein
MYYVNAILDMINGIHVSNAITNSQLQSMTEASPDNRILLLQFIMKQFPKARISDNHYARTIMCEAN